MVVDAVVGDELGRDVARADVRAQRDRGRDLIRLEHRPLRLAGALVLDQLHRRAVDPALAAPAVPALAPARARAAVLRPGVRLVGARIGVVDAPDLGEVATRLLDHLVADRAERRPVLLELDEAQPQQLVVRRLGEAALGEEGVEGVRLVEQRHHRRLVQEQEAEVGEQEVAPASLRVRAALRARRPRRRFRILVAADLRTELLAQLLEERPLLLQLPEQVDGVADLGVVVVAGRLDQLQQLDLVPARPLALLRLRRRLRHARRATTAAHQAHRYA